MFRLFLVYSGMFDSWSQAKPAIGRGIFVDVTLMLTRPTHRRGIGQRARAPEQDSCALTSCAVLGEYPQTPMEQRCRGTPAISSSSRQMTRCNTAHASQKRGLDLTMGQSRTVWVICRASPWLTRTKVLPTCRASSARTPAKVRLRTAAAGSTLNSECSSSRSSKAQTSE